MSCCTPCTGSTSNRRSGAHNRGDSPAHRSGMGTPAMLPAGLRRQDAASRQRLPDFYLALSPDCAVEWWRTLWKVWEKASGSAGDALEIQLACGKGVTRCFGNTDGLRRRCGGCFRKCGKKIKFCRGIFGFRGRIFENRGTFPEGCGRVGLFCGRGRPPVCIRQKKWDTAVPQSC